jgi:hypothetical protein
MCFVSDDADCKDSIFWGDQIPEIFDAASSDTKHIKFDNKIAIYCLK